jgi:endonuclease/exonuclease/phosphatase family metal-dependent hydrolase
MNYIFVCEFVELHHKMRSDRDQGGGVHGNALLSKFDFGQARSIAHFEAYNWERDGILVREPRKGRRYMLSVEVLTPLAKILVYNLHLEVFCGILDRVRQMADCFEDVRQEERRHRNEGNEPPPILICGDLNTMAHSIARLSPKYCRDKMRFFSFGVNEATWWKRNVFDVVNHKTNSRVLRWGLTPDEAQRAINPGFYDPFNIYHDVTLCNHHGLFQGKLDWILLKHLIAIRTDLGNHDYSASDHKWLRAEIVYDRDLKKQRWRGGGLLEYWTLIVLFSLTFSLIYVVAQ